MLRERVLPSRHARSPPGAAAQETLGEPGAAGRAGSSGLLRGGSFLVAGDPGAEALALSECGWERGAWQSAAPRGSHAHHAVEGISAHSWQSPQRGVPGQTPAVSQALAQRRLKEAQARRCREAGGPAVLGERCLRDDPGCLWRGCGVRCYLWVSACWSGRQLVLSLPSHQGLCLCTLPSH